MHTAPFGVVSQKRLQALAERWGYNSGSVCNQVCATGLCCENGGVSPWLGSAAFFCVGPDVRLPAGCGSTAICGGGSAKFLACTGGLVTVPS